MKTSLLFTHALSPLHAGTGQGIGVIDLPIAREKATGLPFLPGSSVKGALRDRCPDDVRASIFGPDKNRAEEHAGSVQFSDQRLLLLPVRSLAGTFAWVTSPYVLRRFVRDAGDARLEELKLPVPTPAFGDDAQECLVTNESKLGLGSKVYLEDLDMMKREHAEATAWADKLAEKLFPGEGDGEWGEFLKGRFCIVPDDVMSFLLETATEITARVALTEHKTVEGGQLWYEEALPCETVMFGVVLASKIKDKETKKVKIEPDAALRKIGELAQSPVQLGGKATVGRGLCRLTLTHAA